MNSAKLLHVISPSASWRMAVGLTLAGLLLLPLRADEKPGMPDLSQIEETCLPTSTTNLIVWFGLHGYPKLIMPDDSKEDGYDHTVHRIMKDTDAQYDWGTRPDAIVDGIKKYIDDAGYEADVEYRGLGKTQFSQDWLKDNDNPNKGFILLLAYVSHNGGNDTYANAWDAGHAVTLVNATPDMILIHDPAHEEDETGRKILTPEVLTSGTFTSREGNAPVAGLMMLSGSLLDAPPNAGVMLIGAVCITMHPPQDMVASSSPKSAAAPMNSVGGGNDSSSAKPASAPSPAPAAQPAPAAPAKSWTEWAFNLLFSK
jgi:hypothetical protein